MITQCQAAYAEGVTTRADARTILVKFQYRKCLAPLIVDEDIVYSPNKYRETEGAKEIELKELWPALFQKSGLIPSCSV